MERNDKDINIVSNRTSGENIMVVAKRKKGKETQEKILRVAAELFALRGYDAVTMRNIAAAVKIKESSIYNHFDSKQAIRAALFEQFSLKMNSSRILGGEFEGLLLLKDAEKILQHMIVRFGQSIDSTLDHIATIVFVERFRNKQAADLYYSLVIEEQVNYYTRVFQRLLDEGLLPAVNVDAKDMAKLYNNILVTLANEYAMASNGMVEPSVVIKKMIDSVHFFVKQYK
ncbi:TetR/AcrR family transcriptional regulator [Desulfuribacillus alkaliarsenatis]|uniref:HTH tetR-type domain-containing protein n=1 Tax=Desulfuribacillus alkaliarsenatis TaxID=766136 RepID=A0A1E5G3J8_9FIRM|nr:TetR/AcrR family transcriptional regulator [Desulfuribacillus alkaliarsenatis]OEF97162.1 hypothetical protein BHF68_06080 [Desulfuribacillus alkaliarsenatis]